MITDSENHVVARLLERLDRLEAENDRLQHLEADRERLDQLEADRERLDRLEADNAQLRAEMNRRLPATSTSASAEDGGEMGAGDDQALSRRGMLSRLAGAGAAGLGLATGASVLAAKPAGATHAGSVQVGHLNNAGNSLTWLGSSTDGVTFQANNSGSGYGLQGVSNSGIGVYAQGGQAPLELSPHGTVGPPTSGIHRRGEVMLDATGAMFVCRAPGTPGTWTRGGFNGVTPTRIADTRPGTGTPYSTGPIGPGAEREITVAGVAGVHPQAGGVVMNATAVAPTASSYLTIYPSGVTRPLASNLNVVAGGPPTPNLVIVKLGTGGKVRVYNNSGSVHVILDVAGFFS